MRPSNEEKLQEKNGKLQQQLKESKKKIASLENKLSSSERKRKLLAEEKEGDKKKEIAERYVYSLLNAINIRSL